MKHTAPTSRSLIHGTFWSILNQTLSQILVLAIFLITARFLSKSDFGMMALWMLVLEVFKQVILESVATIMYAKKDPTAEFYNAAMGLIFIGTLFSALLIYVLSGFFAVWIDHPEIAQYLPWASVVLVILGTTKMQEVWLGKNLRFKTLAIRSVTSILIGGTIGIWMAVNNYGVSSLIAQQVITTVIASLWLWQTCPWKPKLKFNYIDVKNVFLHSRHTAANNIIGVVSGQSDVFFAGLFLGPAATGVYNAAKRIITAMSLMVSTALNAVALPALAAVGKDDPDISKSFIKFTTFTAYLTAPLYFGLAALSPDLITVVLGIKWIEAAPIMSILCISSFIWAVSQYSVNIFLVFEKAHWITRLSLLNSITTIVLLLLMGSVSLTFLTWAVTFKALIFLPLNIGISLFLLKMKVSDYVRAFIAPTTAAAIMAIFVFGIRNYWLNNLESLPALALIIPAGAVVYFLTCFLLDRKNLTNMISLLHQSIK